MALQQMVNLGGELLTKQVSPYSKLNEIDDRNERRELEGLYYNEIAAISSTIKLFTGREISFQWRKGADGESGHGFALYEIMADAPRYKTPAGCSDGYNRYSGKTEYDSRIDWGKGVEQGKIVKIYELVYDPDANPCYVGGYV